MYRKVNLNSLLDDGHESPRSPHLFFQANGQKSIVRQFNGFASGAVDHNVWVYRKMHVSVPVCPFAPWCPSENSSRLGPYIDCTSSCFMPVSWRRLHNIGPVCITVFLPSSECNNNTCANKIRFLWFRASESENTSHVNCSERATCVHAWGIDQNMCWIVFRAMHR